MTKKEITVRFEGGLEARPLAMLVQVASQFDSEIHVQSGDSKTVNAKSIMGMMTLGLTEGETVSIYADGHDEAEAIAKIEQFLSASK